jgi:hypothetical protein
MNHQEFFYHGDFATINPPPTSSNQRETTAVWLSLLQSQSVLRENKVSILCVQSDNMTTVSNLARVRGAKSMITIVRKIFRKLEELKIIVIAKYKPGILNQLADSLSRLEAAGDYQLKQEVFLHGLYGLMNEKETMEQLVQIDMFATRENRKLEKFVSPGPDILAVESDAFSISWRNVLIYAHPPIVLIPQTLRKIEGEEAQGVLVIPLWKGQPWWPLLEKIALKKLILGKGDEILEKGTHMRQRQTKLPPGEMMMVKFSGKK